MINEPRFSTVMGLLDYAIEQVNSETSAGSTKRRKKGNTLFVKLANWLRDFF